MQIIKKDDLGRLAEEMERLVWSLQDYIDASGGCWKDWLKNYQTKIMDATASLIALKQLPDRWWDYDDKEIRQ